MLTRPVPLKKFLPSLPRFEPVIMDHTAMKMWKHCKRAYFYRIVLGRKLENPHLADIFGWGNAVHKFMECLYLNMSAGEAAAEALKLYVQPKPDSKWVHLDMIRLGETLKLLKEFYDLEKSKGYIKLIGVEQPFNITLPNGTQIGGRFDMLYEYGGSLRIRDYKTTTKQIAWFIPSLNPNDQATRYIYAASRLAGWTSEDPSTNKLVDMQFMIIENQKPPKSAKRLPVISPTPVSRTSQDLIRWEQEEMFQHRLMEISREEDTWPMEENNCSWCDYNKVCRQPTDSSREWILKNDYVLSPWDHQKVGQEKVPE